ncbi:MAG: hypothetical protein K0R52_903 [Alphaproteobacteria bacterium]|nr:hypothetical protein [Alphaproteobacteria bacterium]
MSCMPKLLFIILATLIIFSTEALEPYHHPSLRVKESEIPLLIPVREVNSPVHLNDASFAEKIRTIDEALLKEAEPLSCGRFALQSAATIIHTFFAVSASTGVFMFTCADVLDIAPQTKAATAMIFWLSLSRAPGIVKQFWSLFHSDPWANNKLIYQKDWRHRTANVIACVFSMLNTSPWIYQMLRIEWDFLYIFGIPAAPFYLLMNAQMNYNLAAPQIERYFYDYIYPKESPFNTYAKRKKLMQSIKEAKQVTAAISEEGIDIIFKTLIERRAIVNSAPLITEEKAQEFDISQHTVDNTNYRLLPDQPSSPSESAMRVLLGMPTETHPLFSNSQELAWVNTKAANERANNDYPKVGRVLKRTTEFVSAFDAVAHGFVLWHILHFLPPGISVTGCVIGGVWRWSVHNAPRQETVHTLVIDGLLKRSIGGVLDYKALAAVSITGVVNAGLQTTIPYVMVKETLQSYPNEVRAFLLASLVAGNFLDYSRILIEDNIALATEDLSYGRSRQGPCSKIDNAFRKFIGCFRSKIHAQKLFISSYSEKAERLVKQGTTNLLDNMAYYFLNQR